MPMIGAIARLARIGIDDVDIIPADQPAEPYRWFGENWALDWLDPSVGDGDFLVPASDGLIGRLGNVLARSDLEARGSRSPDIDTFDPLAPLDRPEVLPAGLEWKTAPEADPVICRPVEAFGDVSLARDWSGLDAGIAERNPHRFLMEPRGLDWIV